jgi:hypothetical protein
MSGGTPQWRAFPQERCNPHCRSSHRIENAEAKSTFAGNRFYAFAAPNQWQSNPFILFSLLFFRACRECPAVMPRSVYFAREVAENHQFKPDLLDNRHLSVMLESE